MPTYEYVCEACSKPFEIRATIADYSKGLKPVCPHCGAKKAIRTFAAINVLTTRSVTPRGSGVPAVVRVGLLRLTKLSIS